MSISLSKQAELQDTIEEMAKQLALGVVALVQDGSHVWRSSSGVRDLTSRRPTSAGDLFRAGSVVKSLIAVVVLQLVAEHRLDLEDQVDKWLPGLVPGEAVTLRQLLNHTSGLFNFTDEMPITAPFFMGSDRFLSYPPEELISLATARPRCFAAGEDWKYSNTNYVLLSLVIEKVTGQLYEQVLRKRIFDPLSMNRAFLPSGSPFMPGPHMRSYAWLGTRQGPKPVDITMQCPTRAWGSGDLISDTADLSRFLIALFSGRLLPHGLMAEMLTFTKADSDRHFGLGVLRTPLPGGGTAVGNTGAYGGYITYSLASEDGQRTAVIAGTPRSGQVVESLRTFAATAMAAS